MQTITTPAGIYTPPATALIQKVQLRIFESCPSATLRLMQYDRALPVIAVELFEGGNPYKVPENAAVNIRMVKPDKTTVYNPALGVSSDRKTTYIGITPQMTACFGSCTATLEIALNDGVLGTGLLRLSIEKNPVSEDAVESSDEYLSLQEIVNKVQTYADQASTAAESAEAAAESAMKSAQSDLAENNETAASYVKNRTHWKKHIIDAGTVLAETSVAFTASLASVSGMGTNNVKVDGNYVVKWNGTSYDCTAYDMDGSVCLGNAALFGLGGADTGEPFAIEMISATGASVTKNTETAETITLAVEGVETTIWHQLDPRFIPDMYYTEGGGGVEVLLPETTLTTTEDNLGDFEITQPLTLEVGKIYMVKWNGTEYTCTAQDLSATQAGAVGLGNLTPIGLHGNGEPFAVAWMPGLCFATEIGDEVHTEATIAIYGEAQETIHKLDNKYLDLDWLPTAAKTVYIPETTATTSGTVDIGDETAYLANLVDDTGIFGTNEIGGLNGREVTVCYDGVEYTGMGYASLDSTSIGAPGGGPIGGEFMLMEGGKVWMLMTKTEGTHTVEVYFTEPNKMPAEFLPTGVGKIHTVFVKATSDMEVFSINTTFEETMAKVLDPETLVQAKMFMYYNQGDATPINGFAFYASCLGVEGSDSYLSFFTVDMLGQMQKARFYENGTFVFGTE